MAASKYFQKNPVQLMTDRTQVRRFLVMKGYDNHETALYLEAFDFFCQNPTKFDGATIVKDLIDLNGLDLDAMLHDWQYIVHNAGSSFVTKWKSDWMYAKGIERKGKGQYSAFSRFVGLTIIGIFFVPYSYLKRGKANSKEINKQYKTLIR